MKWAKRGRILAPGTEHNWLRMSAAAPFALVDAQSTGDVPVYLSGRDADGRSHVGLIHVDPDAGRVTSIEPEPVLTLGQVGTFNPIDGMRRGIRMCMDLGYTDDQIRKMVSTNTARALGIEADVEAARAAKN